ncbi:hypothetical protein HDK64DRAFT_313520 [Phyllosticta capitalensis]
MKGLVLIIFNDLTFAAIKSRILAAGVSLTSHCWAPQHLYMIQHAVQDFYDNKANNNITLASHPALRLAATTAQFHHTIMLATIFTITSSDALAGVLLYASQLATMPTTLCSSCAATATGEPFTQCVHVRSSAGQTNLGGVCIACIAAGRASACSLVAAHTHNGYFDGCCTLRNGSTIAVQAFYDEAAYHHIMVVSHYALRLAATSAQFPYTTTLECNFMINKTDRLASILLYTSPLGTRSIANPTPPPAQHPFPILLRRVLLEFQHSAIASHHSAPVIRQLTLSRQSDTPSAPSVTAPTPWTAKAALSSPATRRPFEIWYRHFEARDPTVRDPNIFRERILRLSKQEKIIFSDDYPPDEWTPEMLVARLLHHLYCLHKLHLKGVFYRRALGDNRVLDAFLDSFLEVKKNASDSKSRKLAIIGAILPLVKSRNDSPQEAPKADDNAGHPV